MSNLKFACFCIVSGLVGSAVSNLIVDCMGLDLAVRLLYVILFCVPTGLFLGHIHKQN